MEMLDFNFIDCLCYLCDCVTFVMLLRLPSLDRIATLQPQTHLIRFHWSQDPTIDCRSNRCDFLGVIFDDYMSSMVVVWNDAAIQAKGYTPEN